jgi:NADH-quinone oxidoreductase subunit G
VGGHLAGALPGPGGLNAREMVQQPLSAYVLLGLEPGLDHGMPQVATAALGAARTVIALTAFDSPELRAVADCLLPVTPFTETAGTFVNTQGMVQSFNGVVRPLGEARPAWKVLRVLGNLLDIPGFDADTPEQVRDRVLARPVAERLSNAAPADLATLGVITPAALPAGQLERVAHVMPYGADPVLRRAESLQRTRAAQAPVAGLHPESLAALGLADGDMARVSQGDGEAMVPVRADATVAPGTVWLATAHASTAGLASMFGAVTVRKA